MMMIWDLITRSYKGLKADDWKFDRQVWEVVNWKLERFDCKVVDVELEADDRAE
jgi:hypothetical protein